MSSAAGIHGTSKRTAITTSSRNPFGRSQRPRILAYGGISPTFLKAVRLPVVVSGQTKGSAPRVSGFVKGHARGYLKGSDTKDTGTSNFYPL